MEEARRLQLERFRSMTPAERWRAARALYWSMRRLKEAYLRQLHPEWSEERVSAEAKRAFMHVRD